MKSVVFIGWGEPQANPNAWEVAMRDAVTFVPTSCDRNVETLGWAGLKPAPTGVREMVPLVGFELTTYRLQGGCSTN